LHAEKTGKVENQPKSAAQEYEMLLRFFDGSQAARSSSQQNAWSQTTGTTALSVRR
jgi:hypothetical protein